MLYVNPKFKVNKYGRPSDDVDPKYKQGNPTYAKEFAQFIYSQYQLNRTGTSLDDQETIKRNRSYAAGRQDAEIYKDMILGSESPVLFTSEDDTYVPQLASREGFYNINYQDIFSPIPSILNNIQGVLDQVEHNVQVSAIDEKSTDARQQMKYSALVEGEHREFFEYIKATMGIPENDNRPLPKSAEELDMFEKLGSFKLAYEIAMRDALVYTEDISDWKKTKRSMVHDFATIGKAAVLIDEDASGVVHEDYLDIADVIIESSKRDDHRDSTWGAYIRFHTVMDLRANTDMLEDELAKIAESSENRFGNGQLFALEKEADYYHYDNFMVPVLHCYWEAKDSEYTTKHSDGREFTEKYTHRKGKWYKPKVYDTENRTTEVVSKRSLYKCSWIIDTEKVYNFGKVKDIPFDYWEKRASIPIRVYKIQGKPVVESMIPIEDQIQMTYLELQNSRAKAAPSGLKIEISSLENISMGNKKLLPLDVLKIYTATGHLLYRLAPPTPGNPIGVQNPVEQLMGGYDIHIRSAVQALELLYMEMERVTGISQVSVAKSPGPDQGLGVSNLAVQMSNNTLRPIYLGYMAIKEKSSQYSANKIQSMIESHNKQTCPYFTILGAPKWLAIKSAGKYPPVVWAISIKAKPDEATKTAVLEAARAGLAVGKDGVPILSYSDYLYIVDVLDTTGNISEARAFLAWREQRASEESQARAQEQMRVQAEEAQKTNALKAQDEEKAEKFKRDAAIEQIDRKGEWDMAQSKQDHENKMAEIAAMPTPENTQT